MSQNDFQGRNVVVTGGTGALGRAVTGLLAERGAVCHVPCFDERELEEFPWLDHSSVRIERDVDLSQEDSVTAFFSKAGPLWASVHCAGGFSMEPIEELSRQHLERQLNLNLITCVLCCRAAVVRMRENPREGGRIVNVAARPALEPRQGSGMVAYTAAKAAVAAATAALAEEVKEDNIWVNAIAPSILDTPANRKAMPDADFDAWPSVEAVAETIVFLASPKNRSSRGAIVPVYGRS